MSISYQRAFINIKKVYALMTVIIRLYFVKEVWDSQWESTEQLLMT